MKTPDVEGVYAIAIGVDGELCRLDSKWELIEGMQGLFQCRLRLHHRW